MEHEIGVFAVPLLFCRRAQQIERRLDFGQFGLAMAGCRACRRLRFQRQAKLVTLAQVRKVLKLAEAQRLAQPARADETARPPAGIDQPLTAQPLQGIAHHGTRDLELEGQFVFRRQALAGRIGTGLDRAQHLAKHEIAKPILVSALLLDAHTFCSCRPVT